MPSALDELWALQQIDSRIYDIEKTLAALDTGAKAKASRDQAHSANEAAVARLHAIDAELTDIDLSNRSAETKSQDAEKKLYSGKITNPKELEALTADIQMLKRQRDKLETRELELMDEQTEAKALAAKTASDLETCQKSLDDILSSSAESRKKLETELAAAKTERAAQSAKAAAASAQYLKRYETYKARLGKLAVAELVGTACGVCHVNLPAEVIKSIRSGQEMVTCESCGRVLYSSPA